MSSPAGLGCDLEVRAEPQAATEGSEKIENWTKSFYLEGLRLAEHSGVRVACLRHLVARSRCREQGPEGWRPITSTGGRGWRHGIVVARWGWGCFDRRGLYRLRCWGGCWGLGGVVHLASDI